jgi:hypothetical protein
VFVAIREGNMGGVMYFIADDLALLSKNEIFFKMSNVVFKQCESLIASAIYHRSFSKIAFNNLMLGPGQVILGLPDSI